ncbi:RagB/SusD family nutrient uptake outer membrane protein [Filimonas effusa]|uniref:RagB/SusD family nutrient uptake outer membrane protein n=1 Tax=Filimonas effusa TaxID=2508721 RepID=A0A4Q1DE21_9BACT|nr:RagB/SusD family nutrient uptake outer membrane protein [Filimonas effusa]RXK86839.1 RagB/SusD family nutrient uptake outer membrane protein [Filimonas effusa]
MKMFKNIRVIATVALGIAAAVMAGCNKMLDLKPQDQISDGNYWNSAADFKLYATQFYAWTRDFGSAVYDGYHSDTRSDLLTSTTPNIYSNGTNSIPSSDGTFTDAYKRIRLVNELIAKAASYSTPSEIAVYTAEARFFRAYIYFELLQLYGDAIIVEGLPQTNDPLLTAARNSREEVCDFIIKDLNAAIPDLPLQGNITQADAGRVSKGTAQAFLSRVALFEGTWQKFRNNTARAAMLLDIAAKASLGVINSKQYSLFKPAALGDSALKYLFILEDVKSNPASLKKSSNTEYIFSTRHDGVIDPIGLNITHNCFANAAQMVTRKFATMYLCADGLPVNKSAVFAGYSTMTSEFQNRDNRMRYTLMQGRKPYWRESSPRVTWLGDAADLASAVTSFTPAINSGYHNQKWATERALTTKYEGYDFPIIRYAEVLLNYAEAVYERDGAISDQDLDLSLNLVRNRINTTMPKLSNAFVNANGLDMRTEIRRERTVEFYNEGFRIDDLKRWKTAETEMPQDMLGIKWTGTEFQTAWSNVTFPKNADGCLIIETGRKWTNKNYLYPLPSDQLSLNPNLKQNPDW